MVSEQVMEAFCMEQEQQSMFKEMQQILVVMLARLDQYLGNPTRLDQTVVIKVVILPKAHTIKVRWRDPTNKLNVD
jgi:hypothetical protein